MPASSATSTSTAPEPAAPAGAETLQAAGWSKLIFPSALVNVRQAPAEGAAVSLADGAGVADADGETDSSVVAVGDGVVLSAAEAVGVTDAVVATAAGVWSAGRRVPATATPPATAARARTTTAATQGQRRRVPGPAGGCVVGRVRARNVVVT